MESRQALRYYPSVAKAGLLLVACAGFVAAGFWMRSIWISHGDATYAVIGWVSIGVFGIFGLVELWLLLGRLIMRRPWLVIDSHGISCYMGRKLRKTPWDQISDIAIYRQRLSRGNTQYYLVVNARDESAVYKGRAGRLTSAMFPSVRHAAAYIVLSLFFVFCTRAKRQAILQRIRTEFAPELAHYHIFVDERERDL